MAVGPGFAEQPRSMARDQQIIHTAGRNRESATSLCSVLLQDTFKTPTGLLFPERRFYLTKNGITIG